MSETALTVQQGAMASGEYFAAPGLSCSGMKDLAISPLRYWYRRVNPDAPLEEPTPEMRFGSALHCAILEPSEFDKRYACELIPPEGCLVTMDDLRQWLKDHGVTPKGTRKADVTWQVQSEASRLGCDVPILDVLQAGYAVVHEGKTVFKAEDWQRIRGAAEALRNEPRVQEILSEGQSEVAMFARDPETNVLLKAKMDWVRPTLTADLKTFSQQRGKSIDRCVTDAIWYEHYHWQAYLYSFIRSLQAGSGKHGAQKAPEFVFPFVESDPPHEVRIRVLRPHIGGEVNVLWERARQQVHGLIRTYAKYSSHFGEKPWRYACEVDPVVDEEIPGLAFER